MRILAVDAGSRRIGLAVSDEEGRVALPLETVERSGREQAVRAVVEAAARAGAGEILVGLPLHMDGTEGPAARRARRFAEEIGAAAPVPVRLWDERLTTVSAERALREAGVRGRARRRVVDQAAATVLLSGYLEARRSRDDEAWRDDRTDEDVAGAQAAARRDDRRRGR